MNTLKLTQPDFRGQHVFIGLDLGKKNWKTCIVTEDLEHRIFTQPPEVETLVKYLHRHFPGASFHCVYEAGYSGFWVHEQLTAHGIDCIVVNPADVPTKHREKAFKSDRVDARKLARSLRSGELDPVYIPSRTTQEDRSLIRIRARLVSKQTRCKNQIKSLVAYYGISIPLELTTAHWSRRFIRWIEQLTLSKDSGTVALQTLVQELLFLRQSIAHVTSSIRALAGQEPYQHLVDCLVSIPGISTLSAMILLTELVDIRRFRTLDHLASYVGLVPGEHSSGETNIVTGISTRRNPYLRTVLIESAWIAARKDPALLAAFSRLIKRMPKNQAIVRIARKLLNRIRYVLLHQTFYRPSVETLMA